MPPLIPGWLPTSQTGNTGLHRSRVRAPIVPPVALWLRLERSVFYGGTVAHLRAGRDAMARIAPWTGMTAICFLVAASIAGFAPLCRPGMPTPLAVMSSIGAAPAAFVVKVHADGIASLPLHPALVLTDHDFELWSLADGARILSGQYSIVPIVALLLPDATCMHGMPRSTPFSACCSRSCLTQPPLPHHRGPRAGTWSWPHLNQDI